MSRLSWRRVVRLSRHAVFVFVGFLLVGNVLILAMHGIARAGVGVDRVDAVAGVHKIRRIDDDVWAGANPSPEGLASLASAGVTTIVDLRAEHDAHQDDAYIASLAMAVHHIPVRDGQTPKAGDVARVVEIVKRAPGTVFLHCGAGVGRTGTMAAAYLVRSGQADADDLLGISLAIGPPSLEQMVFIRGLDHGDRVPSAIIAASRVLDAPRRIWSNLRG